MTSQILLLTISLLFAPAPTHQGDAGYQSNHTTSTKRSKDSAAFWQKGHYNVADVLEDHDYSSVEERLKRYICTSTCTAEVEFVKGFYDKSLTPELVRERNMKPALFVEIDCDLYVSTIQALDWMLREKLIVVGTLIGYDDFHAGGSGGERQAHHEMVKKYQLELHPLTEVVFEVTAVGAGAGTQKGRDDPLRLRAEQLGFN